MTNGQTRPTGQPPNRDGFALPAVVFTMAILGLLAVAALATANDEHRASRAMRESGAALYAAEAGANFVWGTTTAPMGTRLLDSLEGSLTSSGDSVDLGWESLPSGAAYHAVLHRIDNGKRLYQLRVLGQGAGPWGGQRLVSLAITAVSGDLAVDGAIGVVGGLLDIGAGGGVVVDGNDNVPPGWAGVCDPPGVAMPGIATPDATTVTQSGVPTIDGTPPILEDPSLSVSDFDTMWDQLFAMANKIYPSGGPGPVSIGPVENPPGTCDTGVLDNWGAPTNPAHPCFNYFPIIYVENARLKSHNGQSGQGILLVGCDAAGKCDLEIENGFTFYGMILVQGEFELETGAGLNPAHVYGSVMVKNYGSPTNVSKIWTASTLQYSSCAMKRVAAAAGLSTRGLQPIGARAWSEF